MLDFLSVGSCSFPFCFGDASSSFDFVSVFSVGAIVSIVASSFRPRLSGWCVSSSSSIIFYFFFPMCQVHGGHVFVPPSGFLLVSARSLLCSLRISYFGLVDLGCSCSERFPPFPPGQYDCVVFLSSALLVLSSWCAVSSSSSPSSSSSLPTLFLSFVLVFLRRRLLFPVMSVSSVSGAGFSLFWPPWPISSSMAWSSVSGSCWAYSCPSLLLGSGAVDVSSFLSLFPAYFSWPVEDSFSVSFCCFFFAEVLLLLCAFFFIFAHRFSYLFSQCVWFALGLFCFFLGLLLVRVRLLMCAFRSSCGCLLAWLLFRSWASGAS